MPGGYDTSAQGLEFKSVVMGFLYRISDATSVSMDFDKIADALWASLEPFLDADDHQRWRDDCTPLFYTKDELYGITVKKVQMISLILYRIGVLPQRDRITNKFYEVQVGEGKHERGGLKSHVTEEIQIKQFFMRHLMWISRITGRSMRFDVHVDVLWAMLSPYITQEDMYEWQGNNKVFGPLGKRTNSYRWNIEKLRICMKVLARADFLWQTGMVDEPEEYIDGDKIGIRAQKPSA